MQGRLCSSSIPSFGELFRVNFDFRLNFEGSEASTVSLRWERPSLFLVSRIGSSGAIDSLCLIRSSALSDGFISHILLGKERDGVGVERTVEGRSEPELELKEL